MTSMADTNLTLSPALPDSSGVTLNRRKHPCVLCQQRKVKCDRNDPCVNCKKARVECISPTTLPPKRRKKRFPEAELLARLRRYEDHLRRYGADIDAINGEATSNDKPPMALSAKTSSILPGKDEPVRSLSIRRSLRNVENNLWNGVNQEFRDTEEILAGSSEDDLYEDSPITKTYDQIRSDGSDLLFPSPIADNLLDLHPSPVHIFKLWQTFLDNVNPLIKIFHAPTVQQKLLDASADLENVPKGMEALMFGIYAIAVTSLTDPECSTIFGEEKGVLLARFHTGARQALLRAGLLRSSDMTVLQAFVLFLISCLNFTIDPRAHFCLTGIAVRIAQRMGLTFDGTSYGIPPFEVEMRRRLWWQIVLLDYRISELSGAGPNILNHTWTTKLPLNVNDSDLYPDMRDMPPDHSGVTEMVFVLQRCEICALKQRLLNTTYELSVKDQLIDDLEKHLEQKYMRHCDNSVPLYHLSTLISRSALAKLRMGPRAPHMIDANTMTEEDKYKLFKLSLGMIEDHNAMLSSSNLTRFFWFIRTNFPFPAHVYLLCALRYRTSDELADRAWEQFEVSFEIRRLSLATVKSEFWRKNKDSALQLALANLTLKAWEAREKSIQAAGAPLPPTPRFITHFRSQLASKKTPKSATTPAGSEPKDPEPVGFAQQFSDPFQWFNQGSTVDMVDPSQGFDQSVMEGLMTDNTNMSWEFWNDFMQPSGQPGFENGMNGQNTVYDVSGVMMK